MAAKALLLSNTLMKRTKLRKTRILSNTENASSVCIEDLFSRSFIQTNIPVEHARSMIIFTTELHDVAELVFLCE